MPESLHNDILSLAAIRIRSGTLNRYLSRLMIVLWVLQVALPASGGMQPNAGRRGFTSSISTDAQASPESVMQGAGAGFPLLLVPVLLAALARPSHAVRDTLFSEDFESMTTADSLAWDWMVGYCTHYNWKWGVPSGSGTYPATGHSGTKLLSTSLTATYPNSQSDYLETPFVRTEGLLSAKFYMWNWIRAATNDGGYVRAENGVDRMMYTLTPLDGYDGAVSSLGGYNGFTGLTGVWARDSFDLANVLFMDSLRMAFRFASTATTVDRGWFIDDIMVIGSNPTPQVFAPGGSAGGVMCSVYVDGSGNASARYGIHDSSNVAITTELYYRLFNCNSWTTANYKSGDWGTVTATDKTVIRSVLWSAATQLGEVDTTIAIKLTFTDNHSLDSSVTALTAIDTRLPSAFTSFSAPTAGTNSMGLSWSAITETHFSKYQVWIGTVQSEVVSENGGAQKWDNANDAALTTLITTATTVTGLAAGTGYYIKIKAVDTYGNVRVSSVIYKSTNPTLSPVVTGWTPSTPVLAVQQGPTLVRIGYQVSDADNGTVTIKAQYQIDAGAWNDITQCSGDTGAGITTSDTKKDSIAWNVATEPGIGSNFDDTCRVRVIAFDGTHRDTMNSLPFTVDTRAPTGMTGLTFPDTTYATIKVGWTAPTEKNFHHYEIWWGKVQADVINRSTVTAAKWDGSKDVALWSGATTSTVIDGVNENTTYYFKIWACDSAGNSMTLTDKSVVKSTAVTTSFPYSENFESGSSGYSFQTNWARTNVGAAHSGTWYAGNSAAYPINCDISMVTPSFRMTGFTNAWFTFWHKYFFEFAYDGGAIEVDTTGNDNWMQVVPASDYDNGNLLGNAMTTYNNDLGNGRKCYTDSLKVYGKDSVDLLPYVNASQIRLRFREGSDNLGGQWSGWLVDDIYVYGSNNTAPSITGPGGGYPATAGQSVNGTTTVSATYQVSDAEQSTVIVSAYYQVNSSGWILLTGTGGEYGTVSATSGSTNRTLTWNAGTQLGTTDLTNYQLRLIASDGVLKDTIYSNTFTVDTKAPVGLASFAALDSTKTSIHVAWAAPAETRFNHYEIWYGADPTQVENRSGGALEWDNDNDAALATLSTATTTLTGLVAATKYFLRIWAVDSLGNESASTTDSMTTEPTSAPVITGWDPATVIGHNQLSYDSLRIEYEVYDVDLGNSTLSADYCVQGGTWAALPTPYAGSNLGSVAVSQTTDRSVLWNIGTDLVNVDSFYQVRIRATDGTHYDTNTTPLFLLDTKAPTGLAGLSIVDSTNVSLVLTWTPVSTERHFARYEIYYGTTRANVLNRTATLRGPAQSARLSVMSTARDTLFGLTYNQLYFVKVWAFDSCNNLIAGNYDSSYSRIAPITTLPWSDNVENGNVGWTGNCIGQDTGWDIRSYVMHSGTHAWNLGKGQYHDTLDAYLISPQFNLTSQAGNKLLLSFWHEAEFESGNYDGAIVQVSTNGTTWNTVTPVMNGYNGTIDDTYSNPLGAVPAWVGTWGYKRSIVDMTSYAGQAYVKFRFRAGTDRSGSRKGWNVDDITLAADNPPDNDMTLNATVLNSNSIELSWNPGAVDSVTADTVGIWYKKGTDYPDSANDVTALLAGKYPMTVNKDTLTGQYNGGYYFAACVRNVCNHWSDTSGSAAAFATLTTSVNEVALNAVSGTGAANTFTNGGGVNVGVNQSAEGGSQSTGLNTGKYLCVPIADTTLPYSIDSVQVEVKEMHGTANRAFMITLWSGGVLDSSGSLQNTAISTYDTFTCAWALDPNGNTTWTWAAVNALTAGIVTAAAGTYTVDRVTIHAFYSPKPPQLFDTLGATTTLQAAQRTDGSDTLDIYYQLRDLDNTVVTVTPQYRNKLSGTWTNLTSMKGDTGRVTATDSSVHRRIRWYAAGQLGTSFSSDSIQIRVNADDSMYQPSLTRAAADIKIDTKFPTVDTAVFITDGTLNAGATSFSLDASFIETHPVTTVYSYKLNNGAKVDSNGQTAVSNPSAKQMQVTALNGDDSLVVIAKHTDGYAHAVNCTSAAHYVKPYTPPMPSVDFLTVNSVNAAVNKHSSEVAGLSYAIQVDSSGTTWWVQSATGLRGASADWNTIAGWGNKTVGGLSTPVSQYLFRTRSRNLYNTSMLSNLSPATAPAMPAPKLFDTTGNGNALQAAQRADASDTVACFYQLVDVEAAFDTVTVQYRNGASGTWTDMTHTAGDLGVVAATDSSIHHPVRWHVTGQLGTAFESDTVQLRIITKNNLDKCDTLVMGAANLVVDTKAPVPSSPLVYTTGNPSADTAGIRIDGAFTESHPGSNTFSYKLNNSAYVPATGQASVADPAALLITVALDGNDSLNAIKLSHTDAYGHTAYYESTTVKYVKPYQPPVVAVGNPGLSTLEITANTHASEAAGLDYAVQIDSAATTGWVQADGSRGGVEVWQPLASWGAKTVTGLSEGTRYLFRSKSRNPNNIATQSDWSAPDSGLTLSSGAVYMTLNATPGTHVANQWTVGGATEGDDQAAPGGTASYTTLANQSLVVNIDDPIRSGTVDSIRVSCLLKSSVNLSGTQDGVEIRIRTHNLAYTDTVIDEVATSYTYYTFTWVNNPNTGAAWTWGEIDSLQAGAIAKATNPSSLDTLFADHVRIRLFYTPGTGGPDSGMILPAVAGTGEGNVWSNGGATVGDDALAIGGTEATVTTITQLLSVPIRDTTSYGSIDSVRVRVYAKSDAANKTIRPALRIGGVSYESGSNQTLTTEYAFYTYTWALNPATSSAWTWSNINVLEAGCVTHTIANYFADYVGLNVFYRYQNQAPRLYDTLGVGTTLQAAQRTDASDTVDVWYRLRDVDNSADTVSIDYRNGVSGDWTALTHMAGDSGAVFAADSTTKRRIRWHAAGQLLTSFESDSVQLRIIAKDTGSLRDTLVMASANLMVDTRAPVVATAVTLTAGHPNADSTGIRIDGAFTETHPASNTYYYKHNGSSYNSVAGNNAADPAPVFVTLALNGDDSIDAIKLVHTDPFGHVTTSENTTAQYVVPKRPDAPWVGNATGSSIDVAIDSTNDEAAGLEYAVQVDSLGTLWWIQNTGASAVRGASAAWFTVPSWDTTTLTGLGTPLGDFSFKVKSRNKNKNTVESPLGNPGSVGNTPPVLEGWDEASNIYAEQKGDGSGKVEVHYEVGDVGQDSVVMSVEYYNGATWAACTNLSGDTGKVKVSDTLHRTIEWDAKTQVGNDIEYSNYNLRLIAYDGQASNNRDTLDRGANTLVIDTKVPTVGTIVITDRVGKTADSTPTLTFSSTGADSMRFAGTEAALSGAAFTSYAASYAAYNMISGPGCSGGDGLKRIWVEYQDHYGNRQTGHAYDSTIFDGTPPSNAMTLVADDIFPTDSVIVTWNPGAITDGDADSIGIWYRPTDFPDSAYDPNATLGGVYYKTVSKDTLTGFHPGLYYFILTVRDTLGNWADTLATAMTTVLVPYIRDINGSTDNGSSSGWTGGGASLGDGASAVGGTIDSAGPVIGQLLDVPLQDPTGATGSIDSIRLDVYAKASGTNKKFRVALRVGGVTYEDGGASDQTLTTSYAYYTWWWAKNPATNQMWTWSDLNDLEAGCVTKSGGSGFSYYADHVRVRILHNPLPDNDMTLTASQFVPTSVKLTWNPSTVDSIIADSTAIWYKTTGYPDSAYDGAATKASAYGMLVTADTITGLTANTKYYFGLTARNVKGDWAAITANSRDTITLNAPPVLEGWDEAADIAVVQKTDGSGDVTIDYEVDDPHQSQVIVTAQYYNGSVWQDIPDARLSGDKGTMTVSATTHRTITWDVDTHLGAIEASNYNVRLIADDSQEFLNTDTLALAANNLVIDTKAPVVATAITYTAGHPSADSTLIRLDGAFTEANPGANTYYYKLNGGAYQSAAGDANVSDPAALAIALALTGRDSLDAVKLVHTDDYGNIMTSENTTVRYTKPKRPDKPVLTGAAITTINVAVDSANDEAAGLEYAIQVDSAGTLLWVQAGGALGASAAWDTVTGWGTQTVTGLAEGTKYYFRVKSRHYYNNTIESDFGAVDSITTQPVTVAWTGSVDADWGNASNWSPAFVPVAATNVVFNSGSNNCLAASDITAKTLTMTAAYSGTLDIATHTLALTDSLAVEGGTLTAVNGNLDVNGAVSLSNGVFTAPAAGNFTVAGSWTKTGGTFTHSSGTTTFDGHTPGKTISTGGTSFHHVIFNGTSSWSVSPNLTVAGKAVFTAGTVTLTAITDTLKVTDSLVVNGGTFNAASGTINADGDVVISAGTFSGPSAASQKFWVGGNWNKTGGTYNSGASGLVTFDAAATGKTFNPGGASFKNVYFSKTGGGWTLTGTLTATTSVYAVAGTLNLGSGLTHTVGTFGCGGTGAVDFGSSTLRVTSTIANFSGLQGVTASTGTLEFTAAASTQTFTPKSGATFPLVVHSGAGTLKLATNKLFCKGFSQTAGRLELNGKDIEVNNGGDFSITNGTALSVINADTSLGGRTITVAGNAVFNGQSGNLLTLNPTIGWTAVVTGNLNASYANIMNATASGSKGVASNCINSGGNTGWIFGLAIYDTSLAELDLPASQRSDGSDTVDVFYQMFDVAGTEDTVNAEYRNGLSGSWSALTNMIGDTGVVSGADSSLHRNIRWHALGQLGGAFKSDSLQLRLYARCRAGEYDTLAMASANLRVGPNSKPELYDTNGTGSLQTAQRRNNTDTVDVWYQLLDSDDNSNSITVQYRNGLSGIWTTLTNTFGNVGSVTASDSSVHRLVRWWARGQLGTAFESDSVQLRIIADDSHNGFDTLMMAAANLRLDTKAPDNVTGLASNALSEWDIDLDWTPSVSTDADSVMIRYRTDGTYPTGPANGTLVSLNAASVVSDTFTGAVPSTTYKLALFLRDSLGHWNSGAFITQITPSENYATWAHSERLYLNTTAQGAPTANVVGNFPVLVRLNSGNFNFNQAKALGQDVRFATSAGTPLAYSIERWDSVPGLASVWVLVTTVLPNNGGQYINMYWGRPLASDKSSSPTVFAPANGFAGVWHLSEVPPDDVPGHMDATGGGYAGTPRNFEAGPGHTHALGMAGLADSLDGNGDFIDLGLNKSILRNKNAMVLSAWVNPDALGNQYEIVSVSVSGAPTTSSRACLAIQSSGRLSSRARAPDANQLTLLNTAAACVTAGQWQHVLVSISVPADKAVFYYNGQPVDSGTFAFANGATDNTVSANCALGSDDDGGGGYYKGVLDEPRIETTLRTPDWIRLCYENQKLNDALITYPPEVFDTNGSVATLQAQERLLGNDTVDVWYQVKDRDSGNVAVAAEYRNGAGGAWSTLTNATGNIGTMAAFDSTLHRKIRWNAVGQLGASFESDSIQLRVIATDPQSFSDTLTQASADLMLDLKAPAGLGGFSGSGSTANSISMAWSAATEPHFSHYEVWYGASASEVASRNGAAKQWTAADDANLANAATATTTITGLKATTKYYVKLWATDNYNNESTAALDSVTTQTTPAPVVTGWDPEPASVAVQVDSHRVRIGYEVYDVDDPNVTVSLQYRLAGGGWQALAANITGDHGTVAASLTDNDTVVWDVYTALGSGVDTSCEVRVIAEDAALNRDTSVSATFSIDTRAPRGMASFTAPDSSYNSITLTWTPVSDESHFSRYDIWYGTSLADVQSRSGNALRWDTASDPGLKTKATGATTLVGLDANTRYYVKLWAYDSWGYQDTLGAFTRATLFPSFSKQLDASNDGYIYGYVTGTNYGGGDSLKVNAVNAAGGILRSLIRFGSLTDSVPAGATVDSAKLVLYSIRKDFTDNTMVYRLLKNWSEYEATWTNYRDIPTWTAAGAAATVANGAAVDDAGWDRCVTQEAIFTHNTVNQPYLLNVSTAVRSWVRGAWHNYGLLIKGSNETIVASHQNAFGSRENPSPAKRPYLLVWYRYMPPVVTGPNDGLLADAMQIYGQNNVRISYEVDDEGEDSVTMSVQYRKAGGTWGNATNVTGKTGKVETHATNKDTALWDARTQLGANIDTLYQVRVIALDSLNNRDTVTSGEFIIDTRLPVVTSATVIQPVQLTAGMTSFKIKATFTEAHPDTVWYSYSITGGAFVDSFAGLTAAPDTLVVGGVTGLKGAAYVRAVARLKDLYGNVATDTSAISYVKPYTPPAPTISAVTCSTFAFDANLVAGEYPIIQYAVRLDSAGTTWWLKLDGTRQGSEFWSARGNWLGRTVWGLSPGAKYRLTCKSRNPLFTSLESDLSPADSATLQFTPELFDTTGGVATLHAGQRKDGSDTVDIYYSLRDSDNTADTVSAAFRNGLSGAWTALTQTAGDAGAVTSTDSSIHRRIRWHAAGQLGDSFESDSVQLRLSAWDAGGSVDTLVMAAADLRLDTKAPSTATISVTDNSGYTNDGQPDLTLSAADADSMRFRVGAGAWSGWLAYAIGKNDLDITAGGDELKRIYIEYKDTTGNVSAAVYDSTLYDATAPVAGVGADVSKNSSFILAGTSSDATSGVASNAWTKVSGTGNVTFGDTASLTSTCQMDADGVYVLRLTVMDNAGNVTTDDVQITWDATAPTVNAGTDATQKVQFNLAGTSSDPTSGVASTSWAKFSGPGSVTFGSTASLTSTCQMGSDGVYVLRLTSTDNAGNTNTDDVQIIWDATGPTANAGT
ncbi:MAG: DUF2341 domain-containing protein, partial [Fibrobacterota bacterium]